jgi:hypothetical protein
MNALVCAEGEPDAFKSKLARAVKDAVGATDRVLGVDPATVAVFADV